MFRIFLPEVSKNIGVNNPNEHICCKLLKIIISGGNGMIGRVINRTRNLWILIIGVVMLLGVVAAILVFTSQQKTEIPQKGVFVMVKQGTTA